MKRAPFAFLALVLLVAACSTAGTGESGPRRNRNLITAEELAELDGVNSVYDAVRRLRATWLSGRGANRPRIFVDGVDLGGLEVLERYRIDSVREVRFVPPADATLRYGTGFGGGVIEIITR
jgi:outer membrane receptor for ferrienterochelin and colicin